MQLQQYVGNQAMLALVQAKLRINEPGDKYEQEADRIAEMVMRMPEPAVQRKCAACASGEGLCPKCAEEEQRLQRKPLAASITPVVQRQSVVPEEEEEELLQTKAAPAQTPQVTPQIATGIQTLRRGGQPLPPSVRAYFEPRFGTDFSHVRVHIDSHAAQLARQVQARAFTVGRDVVFGAGEYAPGSPEGRKLLAHELVHVVQQRMAAGGVERLKRFIGSSARVLKRDPEPVYSTAIGEHVVKTPQIQRHPVKTELIRKGIPVSKTITFARGESTKLSPTARLLKQRTINTTHLLAPASSPSPSPLTRRPLCQAVPNTTPTTCPGRHTGYCNAASCFPANKWLPCACTVSAQICDAVNAFTLNLATDDGRGLFGCIIASVPPHLFLPFGQIIIQKIREKGRWFLKTNQCIWGHWRAALEAIHDPTHPQPATLTPEWTHAVSICRSDGVGSQKCCHAHVRAEQYAIERCGPYDSATFGRRPTDVPGVPICSEIAAAWFGSGFTGDFGDVNDRIQYGKRLCCS